MRDRWGHDRDTGVRGLEIGLRVVKDGAVKIGGDLFRCPYGKLSEWEGKKVEVAVRDAHSTEYVARNPDTLQTITYLRCRK